VPNNKGVYNDFQSGGFSMGLFKWPDKQRQDASVERPEANIDLSRQVENATMPPEIKEVALREAERLAKMDPDSSEYTIGTTYIEHLLAMPWEVRTEDNLDINRAREILEQDHFGLQRVKERILEYLAVRTLRTQRLFRILVVDDEPIARENLVHILSKEGYQVEATPSGVEALKRMQKRTFDLVLTDLKMEKVDGLEVLTRIKQCSPDVAVILVTGYATVDTAVQAMKEGASDYIAKPFHLAEVRSAVSGALDRKRQEQDAKGPVLCFVGPPGTGKTSLGRSIARALERRFVRISLAGLKDEAEIRGHRRTYAGAMPGRIIQEIRSVGCMNPVFMMDEIDKLGQEFKGDPASALLEVLDPEQNRRFMDHYLDVPFDLSRVMFILTANITDPIPVPLLDRMEVLNLAGYTDEEKVEIAQRYLVPRQVSENGLTDFSPQFEDEALLRMIRDYTSEAGLRNLEREIAAVCRKIAMQFVQSNANRQPVVIKGSDVPDYLGPRRFHHEVAEARDRVGVTTGLVVTQSGGEIVFIEATLMKGKNDLILTGSLGEIMRESAQAALSYLRSHAERFLLPDERLCDHDIHIHVPAGAIPKDGPSAGLTIALALLSLFTRRPARREVALTGEITLTGRILPVAGLQAKILAARRAGVRGITLPAKNRVDLEALPEQIKAGLEFHLIESLEEAVDLVLVAPHGKPPGNNDDK
jgi:ATP-dependent Lon protease